MCLYYFSVVCDLLQITIGLCFSLGRIHANNVQEYMDLLATLDLYSTAVDVMMSLSLTIDHEARKTRCLYAMLYSAMIVLCIHIYHYFLLYLIAYLQKIVVL